MTRLLLTLAVALVCAVVMGCSARDQFANGLHIARPVTDGDADARRASSGELPSYEPLAGLSGEITSIGASTTTNLVARVAARFRQIYPDVTLQLTSSLTNIGPSALLDGRADIVPMSRPLKPAEIQVFAAKFGYAPTEIKVAADALAIFVEKRNPVPGLTLEQLDGIFCRTQRRGGGSLETWGHTGLGRSPDHSVRLRPRGRRPPDLSTAGGAGGERVSAVTAGAGRRVIDRARRCRGSRIYRVCQHFLHV
jgi:ABC-type phosphate transport system substrate-binding protein